MNTNKLTSETKEFLNKNFTREFINTSLQDAYEILKQYYKTFSIQEAGLEQSKPTSEFESVNLAKGDMNIAIRELIIKHLNALKLSENDVLSLTIAYVNSLNYDKATVYLIYENDENSVRELYEVLIERRVSNILPSYLRKVLIDSMLMFCSEFEISGGCIDNEYLEDLLQVYCTFNNGN